MPDGNPIRLPILCRALIGAAAWLVPSRMRSAWVAKWRDGATQWWAFLQEREEFLIRDGHAQLVRHCASAFYDAFWLRFQREELRRIVRGPAFVLIPAAVFLIIIAATSGGFRTLRSSWNDLPYPDPAQLTTIAQQGALGPYGIPRQQIASWRKSSQSFREIEGYVTWRAYSAAATPNLFAMLGIRPELGRLFRPGDTDVALLGDTAWRTIYGADRRVIGRPLISGGQLFQIIGVLPPLTALPDAKLWTVLDVQDASSHQWLTTIARLRPGVDRRAATQELNHLANLEMPRKVRTVRVDRFRAPMRDRIIFYTVIPCFGLIIGIALAAVARQAPVAGHLSWKKRVRCWAFLVLKTFLVLAGITAFWIEVVTSKTVDKPASELVGVLNVFLTVVPTWGFLLVSALAVLWCVTDQRKRCPVCLGRLELPTTIGSWGTPFLDPVTTELVCAQGHGSLALPENPSSSAEPDRWTAMDESWRDLFTSK